MEVPVLCNIIHLYRTVNKMQAADAFYALFIKTIIKKFQIIFRKFKYLF